MIGLLALILLIFGVVCLIQGFIAVGVICILVALVLDGFDHPYY